jgi:broad specificity phosphatase PhoE
MADNTPGSPEEHSAKTKTIYLIRHGVTAGNRALFHQPDDLPLSDRGLIQAHCLIDVLDALPIDAVLASDLFRAKETATIAAAGRYAIETMPLFREIRRPSTLIGKHFLHPQSIIAMGAIYIHAADPDWHWSDEESVHDTYVRANDALNYLADRPEECLVVFTHRGFIASLLSVVKNYAHGSVKQFLHAGRHSMTLANASVTTLTWRDEPCTEDGLTNACWHIASVNDIRHLKRPTSPVAIVEEGQ